MSTKRLVTLIANQGGFVNEATIEFNQRSLDKALVKALSTLTKTIGKGKKYGKS